jgi:uncharacterized protein
MTPTHTALRVDVADLLTHPVARRSVALTSSVPGLAGSAARVPEDEPVELDLILERVPDGIVVRGTISARWHAECSACLRALERTAVLEVSELFEPDPLEGDTYPLLGHELDLEQLVRDSVLLDLPLAPTCESAGVGDCADDVPRAEDEPVPDPRWRALSELEL